MKLLLSTGLLASAALAQATAQPNWSVVDLKPDLVLVIVMSWSLIRSFEAGMAWALMGGLVLDFLSAAPLGTNTTALLVTATFTLLAPRNLFSTMGLLPSIAVGALTFVYYLTLIIVLGLMGWGADLAVSITTVILPAAIINGIITPFFYWPLLRIHRRSQPAIGW